MKEALKGETPVHAFGRYRVATSAGVQHNSYLIIENILREAKIRQSRTRPGFWIAFLQRLVFIRATRCQVDKLHG